VSYGAGQRRGVIGGNGLQRAGVQGQDGRRDLGGLDRTALGVVADPRAGHDQQDVPVLGSSPPCSAIFLVLLV